MLASEEDGPFSAPVRPPAAKAVTRIVPFRHVANFCRVVELVGGKCSIDLDQTPAGYNPSDVSRRFLIQIKGVTEYEMSLLLPDHSI